MTIKMEVFQIHVDNDRAQEFHKKLTAAKFKHTKKAHTKTVTLFEVDQDKSRSVEIMNLVNGMKFAPKPLNHYGKK